MTGEASGPDAEWRAALAKVLRGADPETLVRHTQDAIPIRPLYPAADRPSGGPARPPGRWRICQRIDDPDPAEANRLALADLDGGADSLALVAADAPSARGSGLRVQSVDDLETLLAGVRLELIELRLDPGPHGFAWPAMLAELAERRGQDLAELDLDLGIDPVAILATCGALPVDWTTMARRIAAVLRSGRARGFSGRAFRADGRPWADAGASEAQELAAVLGAGVLYLRALEADGLPLDSARSALSFTLSADPNLVLTVGKFRALRSLWARVEQLCGLEPQPITIHAETAWRQLSARAPHTNIVRGAIACFAAAVSGADGITALPFTLPLGLPDAFARRLARNTQHLLAEEAHLWRVSDPAAGAGAFENLTEKLCGAAWQEFQEIEREGGIVNSLAAGQVQRRIAAVAKERRARLADGRDGLVGVTVFRNAGEAAPAVLMRAMPQLAVVSAGPLRAEPLVFRRAAEPFESEGAFHAQKSPRSELAAKRPAEGRGIEPARSCFDAPVKAAQEDEGREERP